MVARSRSEDEPSGRRRRPATTPEGRENQLASIAMNAIENRILNGTASAQELVFFAKAGSPREQLEKQRLAYENELTRVKIEALESQKNTEALYHKAITAMRGYSGMDDEDEYVDEYQD